MPQPQAGSEQKECDRLSRVRGLWIIWVCMIVLVTTLPWSDFQGHSHWGVVRWIPFQHASLTRRFLFDLIVNVLLYVPFGYLYLRFKSPARWAGVLGVTILATTLSLSTELFQIFTHHRVPSMTDVCMNLIGAQVGAAIAMIQGGKGRR